jgi:hypothetical protein
MNKQVILAVVLFYVVSNPATYKLVESFLGRFFRIAKNGSPTFAGLLVHAVVFGALLMFLLPKISGLKHTHKHEHTHEHEHENPKFGPKSLGDIISRANQKKRDDERKKRIEERRKQREEDRKKRIDEMREKWQEMRKEMIQKRRESRKNA